MLLADFGQADLVGWICLVVGVGVLLAGALIGVRTSLKQAPQKAEEAMTKIDEAQANIVQAKAHLEQTSVAVGEANLEGVGAAADGATQAAEAAQQSTEAAKSALEQVQSIVGSLPENLRFAGLLVLVGTVLISVATIQFGGVSLF